MSSTADRAAAVRQAAALISETARAQWQAEPHHEDFRVLADAMEQLLDALFGLNGNIGGQLAGYGEGRQLAAADWRSPAQVLAAAMEAGRALDMALRQGRVAAHALAAECAQLEDTQGGGVAR